MDDFLHKDKPNTTGHHKNHPKPSSSELLSSAKLLAEATRSTFNHDSAKVDMAKVAGAAENLLGAASEYANLDEKRYGRYVDKAEEYLHQYHSSHSTTTTTTGSGHSTTTTHSSTHSGGGYGDYLKLAEGFLKKH